MFEVIFWKQSNRTKLIYAFQGEALSDFFKQEEGTAGSQLF